MKIADVGIAKNESDLTGTVIGTPLYMAPEVLSESGIYNARADIYSFGLILWELWYGQRVFTEIQSPMKLMTMIEEGYRPQHIEGCRPVIPALNDLMQKCWKTDPTDRLDALECAKELDITLKSWNEAS